jgi:hypothetical protein
MVYPFRWQPGKWFFLLAVVAGLTLAQQTGGSNNPLQQPLLNITNVGCSTIPFVRALGYMAAGILVVAGFVAWRLGNRGGLGAVALAAVMALGITFYAEVIAIFDPNFATNIKAACGGPEGIGKIGISSPGTP